MIGWLKGTLREKRPPQLLLELDGIGYELEAPMTTFYALPELGQEVALYAHQLVREDSVQLYAFARRAERDLFRSLLRVNGVGAKVALAILSGMDAPALARCIRTRDTATLAKIPGIGKKTAERLVVELGDRLLAPPPGSAPAVAPGADGGGAADPAGEAVAALVALGFKPQEATRRVSGVESPGLACEEIVRRALQGLGA